MRRAFFLPIYGRWGIALSSDPSPEIRERGEGGWGFQIDADVDGDTGPIGDAPDAGADEVIYLCQ